MTFHFKNLDAVTRQHMIAEIQADIADGKLYMSDNLNAQGRADYPKLLLDAAASGSDTTLGAQIQPRLNTHEKPRQLKDGKLSAPPIMRSNAHEMLAEGEFNRFYVRAICTRAIQAGTLPTVYRAKAVATARTASQQKIGQTADPVALLADLRNNIGIDLALGLPAGPNSGLSVEI